VRDKLASLFVERGLPFPANIVETDSLPVVTTLLRTTNMVAPLPVETVQHYCETGVLTVLCGALGMEIGPFGIITRRGYKLSPAAQVMLQALRETAAEVYHVAPAALCASLSE
jgi:DNA-binding transcriptional LysR family regulator